MHHRMSSTLLGAALALTLSGAAVSATLNLTDTVTATGTGTQTYTVTPSGLTPQNLQFAATTQANLGNTLTLSSGNTNFSQYNSATNPQGANGSPFEAWNFQDDYDFGTTAATVQSSVIALTNFGGGAITDLQARIIYASGNTATSANPVLGPPSGGAVVDGWQNLTAQTITFFGTQENAYAVTMPTAVGAGQYILQIRGEATTGTAVSYGGAIGFTPVPLPAGLPLLLSGLCGFGVLARRRLAV